MLDLYVSTERIFQECAIMENNSVDIYLFPINIYIYPFSSSTIHDLIIPFLTALWAVGRPLILGLMPTLDFSCPDIYRDGR